MLEAEEVWQRFSRENSVHVCMRSDCRETCTGKVVIYTSQRSTGQPSECVFLFIAALWQPYHFCNKVKQLDTRAISIIIKPFFPCRYNIFMVYEAQLIMFADLAVWEFSFRVVKQHSFH